MRFIVRTDFYDPLVRELRSGEIDLFVGLSMTPPPDARHSWAEEVVWVRGPTTRLDPDRPVPLVSYGEQCVYHRLAVTALKSAGLDWEDVFTGPSLPVSVARSRPGSASWRSPAGGRTIAGMMIWDDAPLPKLPDLYSGIYMREGGARAVYEQLADDIAAVFYDPVESPPDLLPGDAAARKATTAA